MLMHADGWANHRLTRRRLLGLTVAGVGVTVLNACGGASGSGKKGSSGGNATKVRLAIPDPANSSVGVTAKHYAKLIEKKSNGQIKVEVFPNGTLFGGDQNAAINQLQSGALDMLILSTSVYASVEPRMNAISLPYLFSTTKELKSYLEGKPGQELLSSLGKLNTKGLTLMTRTFRDVTNSKRPISKPEDLKGLKIRVPDNKLWVKFFGSLGVNPTPMDFSEVYSALQLNTIDGQENPVEVPVANKLYEVQKYLSLTRHIADSFVLGINNDFWGSLSSDNQDLLSSGAKETAAFKTKNDAKEEERFIEELKKKGMKVNKVPNGQMARFRDKARKLYPQFESLIGKEFMKTTLDFAG